MIVRNLAILLSLGGLLSAGPANAANIVFEFNAGFDDPTPVNALSTNPGTTLGQQRQNLFQAAGQIWADLIESPVTIVIEAEFTPLQCTGNGAVLGSAGSTQLSTNANLMGGQVFYPRALADALLGTDQDPGESDIRARFNSQLDAGSCGSFAGFYYGLDNNVGAGQSALFSTVLHEIAHGLGFSSVIGPDGELPPDGPTDIPAIFDLLLFDVDDNEFLVDLPTAAARAASVVDDPNLVWDGVNVTNALPGRINAGINDGSIRMYAPQMFEGGSSVSHFSTDTSPDLLMEPFLTPGLAPGETDLTPFLFRDLGYTVTIGPTDQVFASGFEDGE